jgi:hypothetical protein
MKYIYSKHILERMNERNITSEEINSLFSGNVDIVIIPSKQDENVELILA